MKQFTRLCNPFNCKIFRFYFRADGVTVVTGVDGDSGLTSSHGGTDPDKGENAPSTDRQGDSGGALADAVSVPPRKGGKTFLELFPQLFLFPLLIVIVLVLVWVFFGAIAQDNRGITELLRDIQAGGGHSRMQDAKALADLLVAKQVAGRDPYLGAAETRRLLQLAENTPIGEGQLKVFLVVALGRCGQPQLAVPFLLDLLARKNLPEELRQATVRGLGLSGDRRAVLALLGDVDRADVSTSWQSRWEAVAGVVNILLRENPGEEQSFKRDPQARVVVEKWKSMVNDPRREISWTTAFRLAKHFGDDSGEAILENILSWDFLDKQRGDNNRGLTVQEKELWMCQALEGLHRLRGAELRNVLVEKQTDRSLAVRGKALMLLERLDKET